MRFNELHIVDNKWSVITLVIFLSTSTLNPKLSYTVSHELLYLNSVLLSFSFHIFSSSVPLLSSCLSSSILSTRLLLHHLTCHAFTAGLLCPLPCPLLCPLFSVLTCPSCQWWWLTVTLHPKWKTGRWAHQAGWTWPRAQASAATCVTWRRRTAASQTRRSAR